MTNFTFSSGAGNLINMGVAGGQVKGSSGYAFHFIQEKTKTVIADVVAGTNPLRTPNFSQKKFQLYDAVLLRVLQDKKLDGATIFTQIFSKNLPDRVFRFLNKIMLLKTNMHLQILYVQSNNKQFNLNLLIFLNLINKLHAFCLTMPLLILFNIVSDLVKCSDYLILMKNVLI
jgi:lycopene beta-cyclase